MKKTLGFTLVELLVVIAIIAVLGAVGATVFRNVMQNTKDTQKKANVEAIARFFETKYDVSTGKYPSSLNLSSVDTANGQVPSTTDGYIVESSQGDKAFRVCANLAGNDTCGIPSSTCYCKDSSRGSLVPTWTPTPTSSIPTNTPTPTATPTPYLAVIFGSSAIATACSYNWDCGSGNATQLTCATGNSLRFAKSINSGKSCFGVAVSGSTISSVMHSENSLDRSDYTVESIGGVNYYGWKDAGVESDWLRGTRNLIFSLAITPTPAPCAAFNNLKSGQSQSCRVSMYPSTAQDPLYMACSDLPSGTTLDCSYTNPQSGVCSNLVGKIYAYYLSATEAPTPGRWIEFRSQNCDPLNYPLRTIILK